MRNGIFPFVGFVAGKAGLTVIAAVQGGVH